MGILVVLLTALQAYLLGSVDTGILVSKYLYHDDVRHHGSGAAGMTNMLRTFGKKAAALTAAGDVLKGVAAVCIGRWLFSYLPADALLSPYLGPYLAAVLAVIGHLKPIYFGFKGGKGVLVAGGAILAIQPVLLPVLALIFLACLLPTGMVSLGSVVMAASYPVLTLAYGLWKGLSLHDLLVCLVGSIIMAVMVVYMHRSNIQRTPCRAKSTALASTAIKTRNNKNRPFGEEPNGRFFAKVRYGARCILRRFVGAKDRRGVAVRQMRTESRHKEKLPHDKDQRNGADAQQIFQCRVMAYHQMPGNGVEQHFQTAAGAVLGQHLDKLDADDDVQAALQKGAESPCRCRPPTAPASTGSSGTALKTSPTSTRPDSSTSNRLEACMIRLRRSVRHFFSFREERLAEESIGFGLTFFRPWSSRSLLSKRRKTWDLLPVF